MSESSPLRIGIIRADSHAYHFGIFMDRAEPLVLADCTEDSPTRESVHHYFKVLAVLGVEDRTGSGTRDHQGVRPPP